MHPNFLTYFFIHLHENSKNVMALGIILFKKPILIIYVLIILSQKMLFVGHAESKEAKVSLLSND